jgi:hypothetical protein
MVSTLNNTNSDEITSIITNIIIDNFAQGIKIYNKNIVSKMPNTTPEEKKARSDRKKYIHYSKLGLVVLSFGNGLLNDDLINNPDVALELLLEVSGSVSYIVYEKITDKALQDITDGISQNTKTGTAISGIAKIGKAIQIGLVAGNQLIPFLYDWLFEKNYVTIDLINGKPNLYGDIERKIIIETDDNTVIFNSSIYDSTKEPIIYAEQDEILTIKVFAKQKNLFDSDRSPWEVYDAFSKRHFFSSYIFLGDQKKYIKICTARALFSEDIKLYAGSNISLGKTLFSKKTFYGAEAEDFSNHRCYEDESFLDNDIDRYSLENFETESLLPYKLKSLDKNILSWKVKIKDFNSVLQIDTTGYEKYSNTLDKIKILPKLKNLDFNIDTSSLTNSSLVVKFDNSNIQATSQDPISSYVWNWGDGTTSNGTTLSNANHTYTQQGTYEITLTITTQSGAIYEIVKNIIVSIDNIPPTARAGADQTINFNQAVTLIGNESNDSDGNIVSYEWTENGSTLSNDVNFTKSDFSVGTHTITLIVTDNDGATGSDDIIVTILENNTTGTITHDGFSYNEVTSPNTSRVWLDRNLGANRVCTSLDDSECYGDYYQWGRGTDGHEKLDSLAYVHRNDSLLNDYEYFSAQQSWLVRQDWLATGIDDNYSIRKERWSSIANNNICPVGFYVPTSDELLLEVNSSNIANNTEAYNSFLKLPSVLWRVYNGHKNSNQEVAIWSTTIENNNSDTDFNFLQITDSVSNINTMYSSASAVNVRCIKSNDTSTIVHNGFIYKEVTSPNTNKKWLDRNLGSSQVCTAYNDTECYGDYYQWGRKTDGHQKYNSQVTSTLIVDINNTNNNFIDNINNSYDWTYQDNNGSIRAKNWSLYDGNSICPIGYRVPTKDELSAETLDIGITNKYDIFNNFLKLSASSTRTSHSPSTTPVESTNVNGYYWTSSHDLFRLAESLVISPDGMYFDSENRNWGLSVRCIKN